MSGPATELESRDSLEVFKVVRWWHKEYIPVSSIAPSYAMAEYEIGKVTYPPLEKSGLFAYSSVRCATRGYSKGLVPIYRCIATPHPANNIMWSHQAWPCIPNISDSLASVVKSFWKEELWRNEHWDDEYGYPGVWHLEKGAVICLSITPIEFLKGWDYDWRS